MRILSGKRKKRGSFVKPDGGNQKFPPAFVITAKLSFRPQSSQWIT
jgi:hypothetical protein